MNYNRQTLIEQLVVHEGLVKFPYRDTMNNLTIGIGRNLDSRGISDEEAYNMCINDIDIIEVELALSNPIVLGLDSVRQMVLIDMAYNMGIPTLNQFINMWDAIRNLDYKRASEEMMDSRWATQVGGRASTLSQMMLLGDNHSPTSASDT